MSHGACAIRQAQPEDFERVLELNLGSVHFLSPLDLEGLALLHGQASYHRVLEKGGAVAAFLLAFREGSSYRSPNYLWFSGRLNSFLYIDRVVVDPAFRGQGLGSSLYDDLISWAGGQGIFTLACEFDLKPPNPASARFHEGYGFREVGTQWLNNGSKQVSLRVKDLPGSREDR